MTRIDFQKIARNNGPMAIAMHYMEPVQQSTQQSSFRSLLGPNNPESQYNYFLHCVQEVGTENLLARLAVQDLYPMATAEKLDFFYSTFVDSNSKTMVNFPDPLSDRWRKVQRAGMLIDNELLADTKQELENTQLDTWARYVTEYGGRPRTNYIRPYGRVPIAPEEMKRTVAQTLIDKMDRAGCALPRQVRAFAKVG